MTLSVITLYLRPWSAPDGRLPSSQRARASTHLIIARRMEDDQQAQLPGNACCVVVKATLLGGGSRPSAAGRQVDPVAVAREFWQRTRLDIPLTIGAIEPDRARGEAVLGSPLIN
jgi:hypothetical protein